MGRKTVVVLASSGMLAAGAAVPAFAALSPSGATQYNHQYATDLVGTGSLLSQQATDVIGAGSLASAPADADWSLDVPSVKFTEPPPEPQQSAPIARQVERPQPRAAAPAQRVAATTPAPAATAPPQSVQGNTVLEIAWQYLGVPYVYGGSSPRGFDCSGFTQYVYAQAGKSIPRTDRQQYNAATIVSRENAQPGDIIWHPGHVAIYAGDGMQIDAPHTGTVVQYRPISTSSPVFLRF